MKNTYVHLALTAHAGTNIASVAEDAVDMAQRSGMTVILIFNSFVIRVAPTATPSAVCDEYDREREDFQSTYVRRDAR